MPVVMDGYRTDPPAQDFWDAECRWMGNMEEQYMEELDELIEALDQDLKEASDGEAN